ncbi:MAG TPA: hypothetical protein VNE82_05485 [Candidatus Binataceae bacterium]|nr:hypothetical protein [Candidatus Binataceae bacterium]
MTRRITAPRGSRDACVFGLAIVALVLALASIARDASPALADSPGLAWQTIVLKGAAMPQLVGSPESHLEVLALRDGHLAPIPFQVDEVLPDGRYALTAGPEPLADDSPGILDRDDEVAMMLSDLSDRASPPPRELPADALEIETLDVANGARRYAYIAAVPSPRLSPVSYVSYDPVYSHVEGGSYRMTLRGDFPIGLALKNGRGKLSPSLIEGSQVQVTARALMLFKLRLDANGVTNRVLAWHGGPIRIIRRVSHSVKLIFGIESPRVLSEESFYREYAQDSFVARVPWVPRLFFGDVRVRTWLDFTGLEGFALSWPGMEWRPLAPEARSAALAAEIRNDPPEVKWLALKGGGKIVMQTFTPSPDFAILRRRLYYCDPAAAASPDCAGTALQIGYLMTGWEKLASGTHRVNSVLMVLPSGADPDAVAQRLTTAPVVRVGPARCFADRAQRIVPSWRSSGMISRSKRSVSS